MGAQGTASKWRKDMIEVLNHLKSQSIIKVKWDAANDEHVCPLCAARNGKVYTIPEAKEELKGEFCNPSDPDDRCRCSFTAVEFKREKAQSERTRTKRKQQQNKGSGVAVLIILAIVIFLILKIFF